MHSNKSRPVDREILRPLWKVHILHHAKESPIIGNWMMEELREHGYNVSPGTLYPMLNRLAKVGWLKREQSRAKGAKNATVRYRLTKDGEAALVEVQTRLRELLGEVFERDK